MSVNEDLKIIAKSLREEKKKVKDLLTGRKILKAEYDPKDEGRYILTLDNGMVVSFTSSGDDMTSTIFCGG